MPHAQCGQTNQNVGVWSREAFVARPCKMRWFMPWKALSSQRVWQSIFKGQDRGVWEWGVWGVGGRTVCDQLVHNSLISWWWGSRVVSQGFIYQSLGSRRPGALCSWSSSSSSIWWWWRGSHLQNNSGNVHQTLLSGYFREEAKAEGMGEGLSWEGPMGSCCVTPSLWFPNTHLHLSD